MISIITVVRNGALTIEKTILSIINQDYPDLEYIIIDGVSTDGTLEILDKYSDRIAIIISEPDNGIYDAVNKGIKVASGEWVYIIGCDDVLYCESTLSELFLASDFKEYDVVYGNVEFLKSKIIFDGEFDYEKMCNRSICQQAIFYRRELFQKYGYFNTDYYTAADYVFNVELFCRDNKKWLYVSDIIALYNDEGTSYTLPDKNYLNNSFAIRYDNFRPFVSKTILARIFWSSYMRYFLKHNISISIKYLILVIKDVGPLTLLSVLLFRKK